MIIANALEEALWSMRGSAAWVIMAAVFVCGLCGSSDAVMASVLRHQQRSHVARAVIQDLTTGRPEVQWGGCAKALGSSIYIFMKKR